MTPKLQIAGAEATGEFEAVSEAELQEVGGSATAPRRGAAESGVRPSPAAIATRVEAALAASARTIGAVAIRTLGISALTFIGG